VGVKRVVKWYSQPFIADGKVRGLAAGVRPAGVRLAAGPGRVFPIGAFEGEVIRRTVRAMAAAPWSPRVLALATESTGASIRGAAHHASLDAAKDQSRRRPGG